MSVAQALAEWYGAIALRDSLRGAPPEDYVAARELCEAAHAAYLAACQAEHRRHVALLSSTRWR
jgi:hypothetical protein